MTPDQLDLLRKAQSSLEAARLLLKDYPDFGASRAYYSIACLVRSRPARRPNPKCPCLTMSEQALGETLCLSRS